MQTGIGILILFFSFFLHGQQPVTMNGAELKIALEKLQVLGSALYIAAHPDDENTAVLAWLSTEKKVRTGYLSLTRGGGGQNLIGAEKGPLMSVLRTHELLAARQIDGTEQFFTRAVDFGYSKTAKESIAVWGKENILADMVFVIRKFRPDVLLTRFPADASMGGGHGHHIASAVLAVEAFKAAGDASRFPEQLKYVSTWQPKRVLWNTWRPYYVKNIKAEELVKLVAVNVGAYNALLGKSYYEIAARSRSMHKSQGFGAVPRRGERLDYFDLLAGEPTKKDLFEGIDISWNRVPNSEKVRKILQKANDLFQPGQPHKILPLLLEAFSQLKTLPPSYWTTRKTKELKNVIRSCAGLWLEATTDSAEVTPGQEVKVTAMVINRSDFPFTLKKIGVPGDNKAIEMKQRLRYNQPFTHEFSMKITGKEYTHPFWLKKKPQKGIFPAGNHRLKGMAAAPYPFSMKIILEADGREISFETPVVYRWRDPVEGEQIRKLAVTPPVTVHFTEKVFYFPGKGSQNIVMTLRSGPAPVTGQLKLNLPLAWKVAPGIIPFKIDEPFTEKTISVTVTPPVKNGSCDLTADIAVGDKTYHLSRVTIEYPHLPVLTLHPKAEVRMVRVNLERTGQRIGYIMGSGDDIPKYLSQVGYRVDLLSDEDLHNHNLGIYDAVITGVRAYNTRDIMKHVQKRLLDYVSDGGRLIVQYNVSRRLKTQQIGPYPFKLSRKRVAEEEAVVSLLEPNHSLFRFPNRIEAVDFDGWVQERGLYFADQWDEGYTPLLSCHDEGEGSQKGGLLFTRYGKGVFIYTGYSFFRQLPAGVPGALKLFINMISSS
jgi:LmbE family N-acetylglucosaminyl deacetylase